MPRPHGAPRFQGFLTPYYTPIPDALFDELLPDLSGAELKVLLYIMRRTMGFKKDHDTISFSQICRGITTHAGRVLDHGTGLSRSSALTAIRSLEEWGLVTGVRNQSAKRGLEATTYHLRFAVDPMPKIGIGGHAENRPSPMPRVDTALYRKSITQETEKQETEKQETDRIEVFENGLVVADDEHVSTIRRVFTDLSRELGDVTHAPSNATRAVNLWRRSGLTRYAFLTLAYDARRLTRLYQGKQPRGAAIAAKGAYFFAVLENLLAARGGGAARDPPRPAGEQNDASERGGEQPCAD